MAEIPDSVRDRLHKFMAVTTERGATQNEAATAAAKVQAILTEFNLEMAQISDSDPVASPDATREKVVSVLSASEDWQRRLLSAITSNNFCYGQRDANNPRIYTLIGRTINIKATIQVYLYLSKTVDRVCPFKDTPRNAKSILSFKEGCSEMLRDRLNEQRYEAEAASRAAHNEAPRGNGSDLVLSEVYSSEADLNWDFYCGKSPGTTARERAESRARWAAERVAREEAARNAPAVPVVPETAAQKRAREANDRKWQREYDRRRKQEEAKRDPRAYAMGQDAGSRISLDRQIEGAKNGKVAQIA